MHVSPPAFLATHEAASGWTHGTSQVTQMTTVPAQSTQPANDIAERVTMHLRFATAATRPILEGRKADVTEETFVHLPTPHLQL